MNDQGEDDMSDDINTIVGMPLLEPIGIEITTHLPADHAELSVPLLQVNIFIEGGGPVMLAVTPEGAMTMADALYDAAECG